MFLLGADDGVNWIQRIRGEGITLPIHLGIPGVMELRRLMAVAARIGVSDSARYLMKHRSLLGHFLRPASFGADTFPARPSAGAGEARCRRASAAQVHDEPSGADRRLATTDAR